MDNGESFDGLQFYRCTMCSKIVSIWDIKELGKCANCGGVHIRETELSLWEKAKQICKHPKVWTWKHEQLV